MTNDLTVRILDVLSAPGWKADPPGSGVIAEVLGEPRQAVLAALNVLATEGKVEDVDSGPYVGRAGWALTTSDGDR